MCVILFSVKGIGVYIYIYIYRRNCCCYYYRGVYLFMFFYIFIYIVADIQTALYSMDLYYNTRRRDTISLMAHTVCDRLYHFLFLHTCSNECHWYNYIYAIYIYIPPFIISSLLPYFDPKSIVRCYKKLTSTHQLFRVNNPKFLLRRPVEIFSTIF